MQRSTEPPSPRLSEGQLPAERALRGVPVREPEGIFRVIVDTALDAVITMDGRGLITSWNARAEEVFGWSRSEVLGARLADTVIPRRHREAHQRGLERYLATGEGPVLGRVLEIEGLHRDGREIPVELAIRPAWQESGSVTFIGFVREITDRRTSERRFHELSVLLESARRLGASLDVDVVLSDVVQLAVEAMTHRGPSGRRAILYAIRGPMAVEMAAYDEDLHRHSRVEFPLEIHAAMRRAIDSGAPFSCRFDELADVVGEAARRTGMIAGAWVPVMTGSELFGVLSCASRDEQDFDDFGLRLLEGIARLAGLAIGNAERYRVAIDTGERLAALERAKTRFLRVASHDLRQPLTALTGYLALIREGAFGPVPPPLLEATSVLEDQAMQMTNMVMAMFDTALLEDERLELQLVQVDLRELVREAVARVAPMVPGSGNIATELPQRPVMVQVDAARIGSVVTNLLGNAVKYSMPGSCEVRCSVRVEGERIEVAVSDRGVGIPAEHLGTLFTRFGRIVTPATAHIPGAGLGLYLSRELARLHGGDVVVASEPQKGSTFTLLLPRQSVPPQRRHQRGQDRRTVG